MPNECAFVFCELLFVTTLCVTALCVTTLCVTGGIVLTVVVPLEDVDNGKGDDELGILPIPVVVPLEGVDNGKGDDELGILPIPGNNKVPYYRNTSFLLLQMSLNIFFE